MVVREAPDTTSQRALRSSFPMSARRAIEAVASNVVAVPRVCQARIISSQSTCVASSLWFSSRRKKRADRHSQQSRLSWSSSPRPCMRGISNSSGTGRKQRKSETKPGERGSGSTPVHPWSGPSCRWCARWVRETHHELVHSLDEAPPLDTYHARLHKSLVSCCLAAGHTSGKTGSSQAGDSSQ